MGRRSARGRAGPRIRDSGHGSTGSPSGMAIAKAVFQSAGAAHLLSDRTCSLTNAWHLTTSQTTTPMLQHGNYRAHHDAHESRATAAAQPRPQHHHHHIHSQFAKDHHWKQSINFNIITNIERQHVQEYNKTILNCWTLNFNFNNNTDTAGQYMQEHTTQTMNCHQWNNGALTLNYHLELIFDMNGNHATNDLNINFQPDDPPTPPRLALWNPHAALTLTYLHTDNAIGSYQASDETEFGRFIHDQMLIHQLTAINTHIDVVKYVKLNWKIHAKLRSLLHVADHVPMIMQIKMPVSGANIKNNNIRWDFGLLAAGLQTGAHRAAFLNDVYAEISKHREVIRVVKMDHQAVAIGKKKRKSPTGNVIQGEISADPNVHPWAKQLADDLMCLSSHDWRELSGIDHYDGYEQHSVQQQKYMQHRKGHLEWLLFPLLLLFLYYLLDQGMTPKQRAAWRLPLDSSQGSKGSGAASSAAAAATPIEVDEEDNGEKDKKTDQSSRRPARRGGRRGRRGNHNPKVWTSKDKNLMDLLRSTLKLLLQTTHKTRLNSSISTDAYTMSNEHPVTIAITQELEGYMHTLDSLRKSGTPEDKKRLQEIGPRAKRYITEAWPQRDGSRKK
ncbi:unnamed protein product [Prorocentrum cordatum]|uniref:Uncharacterized protein n=1 Tax=Prorocentrum cordatum TaxID=2364126 RepID=A0ABN9RUY4_9DINO|nr:unnamed protein product [Polarella glacialis]